MRVNSAIAQLRTADLHASVRFYTEALGFKLEFRYEDFYAGIRAGAAIFHLKLVDAPDPSIAFAQAGEHFHLYFNIDDAPAAANRLMQAGLRLVRDLHETPWGTREFALHDDQGHILYFAETPGDSTV